MLDEKALNEFYKKKETDMKDLLNINPSHVNPVVTQKDAKQGYLMRYFIRPVNDKTMILEIDKNQYENLKSNVRFITVAVKWRIVGKKETLMFPTGANTYGVGDMNRIEVANADLKFGGLKTYISDYLQYWFSE